MPIPRSENLLGIQEKPVLKIGLEMSMLLRLLVDPLQEKMYEKCEKTKISLRTQKSGPKNCSTK